MVDCLRVRVAAGGETPPLQSGRPPPSSSSCSLSDQPSLALGGSCQDSPRPPRLQSDGVFALLRPSLSLDHHQHLHLLHPLGHGGPPGVLLRLLPPARGPPVVHPGSNLRCGDPQLPRPHQPGHLPAAAPPAPPHLGLLPHRGPGDGGGQQTDQVLQVFLHQPAGRLAAPAHQALHLLPLPHLGDRHLRLAGSRALHHLSPRLDDGPALL